jgi:hypothetical protein
VGFRRGYIISKQKVGSGFCEPYIQCLGKLDDANLVDCNLTNSKFRSIAHEPYVMSIL